MRIQHVLKREYQEPTLSAISLANPVGEADVDAMEVEIEAKGSDESTLSLSLPPVSPPENPTLTDTVGDIEVMGGSPFPHPSDTPIAPSTPTAIETGGGGAGD
ncbi:hypothetical protein KIPB_015877, partial [Kipferlia bialata]|eukprot:g15877.t1